jgi:hypothetical protein
MAAQLQTSDLLLVVAVCYPPPILQMVQAAPRHQPQMVQAAPRHQPPELQLPSRHAWQMHQNPLKS